MKKVFTLLFVLMSFAGMYAQTLFETNFATEEDFAKWTVIDNNGDGSTWKFDSTASTSTVFYTYSGANAADDWIISPAITSTETGSVAIRFKAKGSSYGEKLEVFYGSAATVDGMTGRVCEEMYLNDSEVSLVYIVNVVANEPFYLGFHACSDADKWRLYLGEVAVSFTSNPVDLRVTEILTPVSDFGLSQESVTVKVKNVGGVDVTSFDAVLTVNESVIATETVNQTLAAGAEMEYTFVTKADLSEPRKTYTITAATSSPDDINPANDATSKEVLHKASASIPYAMGFEASEYTDGITFFNLNEDDGDWNLYSDPYWSLARTGDYCLAYNYNKNNNGNDWAILEPITIAEAGYYVLKFWYSTDDSHPESFAVYYGNEQTPEAMTNQIVDLKKVASSQYQESISIIYIDSPQTLCLGFHSYTDKDENWICVDDLSFEKISADNVDLAMQPIAHPGAYVRSQSKDELSFSVRSLGIIDATAKVKVMIDDAVVSETDETIKAQEIKQFVVTGKLAGLSEGIHTLKAVVTAEDDENEANNTVEIEFRVLGDAVKMWDFEDGNVPAEFKFRAEDGGTVNPSAGDEFNEYGWGIFNISVHPQYGNHMFAGTSWLDGTDQADRWCILPELKITSEESFLVWDAASFNPSYLEDYSIMISVNGDNSYFTEDDFYAESTEFKTRGLDLSVYVDNNIYIAFRLRSKNCDNLILDNIGLYGGVQILAGDPVSVEDTLGDSELNVVLEDDCIKASKPVESMALVDMSGKVVAQTADSVLPISHIAPGVYVVKAVAGAEMLSKKVVIK